MAGPKHLACGGCKISHRKPARASSAGTGSPGGQLHANACSSLTLPNRKLANFWLADSVSGNIFKVKFADGTFNTYDTNTAPFCPSGGCGVGIHSILIYGGEGANQPGLASLVLNGNLNSVNLFTSSATIVQNTITSTLSNNGSGSPPATDISLYASLVDQTSCFNDPSAGSLPCRPTVCGRLDESARLED